jgi:multidrug efflux pump
MKQVEAYMLKQPEVQSMVSVLGFSFSGSGQNAALGFVTLKDWDLRPNRASRRRRWPGAPSVRWRASATPSSSPEPAADPRAGPRQRLRAAPAGPRWRRPRPCWPRATSCSAPASQSPLLRAVRPDGLEDAAAAAADIDRDKAQPRWA